MLGWLLGWGERGIRPAILVEDLDALLVALGALHALPPRCEIVVVVHDGRLEAFDAIGASQRCEAHLKHEQAGAVDVELTASPDDEAALLPVGRLVQVCLRRAELLVEDLYARVVVGARGGITRRTWSGSDLGLGLGLGLGLEAVSQAAPG